ncbi:MAG: methyltransferase domain-containing protein [Actinomycetota bacterium]
MTPDPYLHGHSDAVMKSHTWRTVENSAPHVIPHLRGGLRLLDVGCGPGTITVDLATRVAPGPVVGFDVADDVIERAAALLDEPDAPTNCTFHTDDVYAIDAADDSFDLVHAHQVLQHLTDPVAALREMHRVLRPGGVLAVRDADYGGMTWAPPTPEIDDWMAIYQGIAAEQGSQPDAGRYLLGWVQAAGFVDIETTVDVWTFATPADRAWWGDLWADRVEHSSFTTHALDQGRADPDGLARIAAGWRRWIDRPDGFFACPNSQIVARAAAKT